MILTGPEIREQIAAGKKFHGKLTMLDTDTGEWKPLSRITHHETLEWVDASEYEPPADSLGLKRWTKMDHIDVEPYDESLVGPNSIDLRLDKDLTVYGCHASRGQIVNTRMSNGIRWEQPSMDEPLDMRAENPTVHLEIPEDGLILQPGILYLGRTIETIGSNSFVTIVEGCPSVGQLGVHVHVTGFCNLGFRGVLTLEIRAPHPVRIYPSLPICQAYFLSKGLE